MIDTYDPIGKGNNYRWKVALNGIVSNDPRQIMVLEDDRVDGILVTGLDLTPLEANSMFIKGKYTFKIKISMSN